MHIFAHIETPEYFLDEDCLLGEVEQVLTIVLLHFLYLKLLPRIETSK